MCSHVCISPAGARSNHISVRNTVHGIATGPPRPFSIVTSFFPPRSRWFTFSDFRLTFAPFFSIFRLSLYTHVRMSSSWSRRCVCSIVSQGAPAGRCTLGNPRATFEFQFCECDSVNESRHQCYFVVVCCCVRTYGTWCLVFGDTLF